MAKQKQSITEYRSYFLPLDFPVLLLSGEHWKISDIPSGRLHFHNCLEIGICHSYGGTIEIYKNPYHFTEGDVTCIPKNVPHTTYSDKGAESKWSFLYIDPIVLFKGIIPSSIKNFELTMGPDDNFMPVLSKEKYPKLYFFMTAIIDELEEKKPGYQLISRGLLLSLYLELWRIETESKKEHIENPEKLENTHENSMVLQPVLDYIDENYMENFSMEYLADICRLSPTHFRRIFHSIMGTSPLEYVNNVRIMKSCSLLRSTEDSILTISESVGFRSISSYNRCFTQIMQTTPREYRILMQQTDKKNEKQTILEFNGWMMPEKFDKKKDT